MESNSTRKVLKFITVLMVMTIASQAQTVKDFKASLKRDSANRQARIIAFQKRGHAIKRQVGENHFLVHDVLPNGKPVYLTSLLFDSAAAANSNTKPLTNGSSGIVLHGEGMVAYQWDAGAVNPHQEYDTRLDFIEAKPIHTHANWVAGNIISSGVRPEAIGMAPKANLRAYYFDDDFLEMVGQADLLEPYMISNHSYGQAQGWSGADWLGDTNISTLEDYKMGNYTLRSAQLDSIVWYYPHYALVWAAGNDRGEPGNGTYPPDCNQGTGYDCITTEGAAKNIITVGGINKTTTYVDASSVIMSGYSSWGPTDDGRIKPDLVAAGTNIRTTSAGGLDTYTTRSGTSLAAPNATGALLLLQEHYGKLQGGAAMKAATLKAVAIHSAREAGTSPGPDYRFGWGLINTTEGAKFLSRVNYGSDILVEGNLTNGETLQWNLETKPGSKITATLVWTDLPSTLPAPALDPTQAILVNDLDIRLTSSIGLVTYPWALDPANPAAPAFKTDNFRDNVEKIELDLSEGGMYTLSLAHKNTLALGSQTFSLLITYSSPQPKTFYWVGGSGNWQNTAHWALSSGGPGGSGLPTENDHVIIDNNSLAEDDSILVNSIGWCKTFTWSNAHKTALDIQNAVLFVRTGFAITSATFNHRGWGVFALDGEGGTISGKSKYAGPPRLDINSGDWAITTNFQADTLDVRYSNVSLVADTLRVNALVFGSYQTKFEANDAVIIIGRYWDMYYKGGFFGSNSTIFALEGAQFYDPEMTVKEFYAPAGALYFGGILNAEKIQIPAGSVLELGWNTRWKAVKEFQLESSQAKPTQISSSEEAFLEVIPKVKVCADYLTIDKISLQGNAKISIGEHSTILGSGWIQGACSKALVADFTAQYACENSLAYFNDATDGTADSFIWQMLNQTYSEKNPRILMATATPIDVSLTVMNATDNDMVQKTVPVVANEFAPFDITTTATHLQIAQTALAYQWYKDDVALENETAQTLALPTDGGVYTVRVFSAQCNRLSTPFVILGLEGANHAILFPIPAKEKMYITQPDVTFVGILDGLGRPQPVKWSQSENSVDVSTLAPGMYFILLRTDGGLSRKRFLVQR